MIISCSKDKIYSKFPLLKCFNQISICVYMYDMQYVLHIQTYMKDASIGHKINGHNLNRNCMCVPSIIKCDAK